MSIEITNRIGNTLLNLALSYVPETDIGKHCSVYQWPTRISSETEAIRELVQVKHGVEIDLLFYSLTGAYQVWRDGVELGGRWN